MTTHPMDLRRAPLAALLAAALLGACAGGDEGAEECTVAADTVAGVVRVTYPAAATTVYDVFGSDGVHAETVFLPFRVDGWIPPTLRGDTLWAVVLDRMDVQHVVRAALRRVPLQPAEAGS